MSKKDQHMTLWHVTHSDNIASILLHGISPMFCQTDIRRCWFVRWYGLAWAIAHLSVKKQVPAWEMVVFRVHVKRHKMRHFNRQVYTSVDVIPTNYYITSTAVMKSIESQRENYKGYKRRLEAMKREAKLEEKKD